MFTPAEQAEIQARKTNQPSSDPDGLTLDEKDDIKKRREKNLAYISMTDEEKDRSSFKDVFDESSIPAQFAAGFGNTGNKIWEGGKELIDDSPFGMMLGLDLHDAEDERESKMREEMHGWGTAGEIAGDVATFAIPGAKVAQFGGAVTKGLPRLTQAATILGGEAALSAAGEGLKLPETGQTRGENAADAAKWTAILGVPFAGLAGARKSVSKEAQDLLDAGVELTPGMAGEAGSWLPGLEKFMSNIPGLSGPISRMQNKSINQWNKVLMDKVAPRTKNAAGAPNAPLEVSEAGRTGFDELQGEFSKQYENLWRGLDKKQLPAASDQMAKIKNARMPELLPSDAKLAGEAADHAQRVIEQFNKSKAEGASSIIENLDDYLRELSFNAENKQLGDVYQEMRSELRKALPATRSNRYGPVKAKYGAPTPAETLAELDKAYREFSVLQKAGGYLRAQEAGGIIDPRLLQSAVKAKNPERLTTVGKGALQPDADAATATIQKVMPGRSGASPAADYVPWATMLGVAGTGGAAAIPIAVASAFMSEPIRKALTGTPIMTSKATEAIARALRNAGVSRIDELNDPVLRNQVNSAVESELGVSEQ